MTEDESTDASRHPNAWADGAAYESYVGRWSRPVARQFIDWLDVGCGTGAVIETILAQAQPDAVTGIDPSAAYLALARGTISDPRVRFEAGSAQALPEPSSGYDVVVSGLVLNFVPQPLDAMKELARVVGPGGTVAVYVWDYAERMQLMRYFWDAAIALDPDARDLDEGSRFSICDPAALATCMAAAGLRGRDARLRGGHRLHRLRRLLVALPRGSGSAGTDIRRIASARPARTAPRPLA